MVMSAYQSKRLRIGPISLSDIFIVRNQRSTKMQRTLETRADGSVTKEEGLHSNYNIEKMSANCFA